jgi:hypothetical protein
MSDDSIAALIQDAGRPLDIVFERTSSTCRNAPPAHDTSSMRLQAPAVGVGQFAPANGWDRAAAGRGSSGVGGFCTDSARPPYPPYGAAEQRRALYGNTAARDDLPDTRSTAGLSRSARLAASRDRLRQQKERLEQSIRLTSGMEDSAESSLMELRAQRETLERAKRTQEETQRHAERTNSILDSMASWFG